MPVEPISRAMDLSNGTDVDDSDVSSELSDAPSLAYDGDHSDDDEPCSPESYGFPATPTTPAFVKRILPSHGGLKRKNFSHSRYLFDSSDSDSARDAQIPVSYYKKRRVVVKNAPFAPIEALPNEVCFLPVFFLSY